MKFCLIVVAFMMAHQVDAMWLNLQTTNVPIQRVIRNLEQTVKSDPTNRQAVAALARIYSMAFATERVTVLVNTNNNLPFFGYDHQLPPDYWVRLRREMFPAANEAIFRKENSDVFDGLKTANQKRAVTNYLDRAIETYQKAIALDSTNAITLLGLGWCLEEKGKRAEALDYYRKAVSLSWSGDKNRKAAFEDALTVEISTYMLPLLDPVKDQQEIKKLNQYRATLKQTPHAVTPLMVPLEDGLFFMDLVDANSNVAFDMDGMGRRQRGWVTPKAGWLVYDGDGSGQITSGLQMFGNVTFWLFWRNGYEALASLDDNGDGILCGTELNHVSIWRDANSNGISDKGEVLPVGDWDITEIQTRYDVGPDGIPGNSFGIKLGTGGTRGSYDLILPLPSATSD